MGKIGRQQTTVHAKHLKHVLHYKFLYDNEITLSSDDLYLLYRVSLCIIVWVVSLFIKAEISVVTGMILQRIRNM